jgi:hypothetical protein
LIEANGAAMDDRPNKERGSPVARSATPYAQDVYTWSVEQAALLRAGRIAEADAANIAEELDDVGSELHFKLESALRLVLLHLLKWDHQPERRTRSWWSTIRVQRNRVRDLLQDNPGLKSRVDGAVTRGYRDGRLQAAAQTHLPLKTFPSTCPYSWKQIMERPISWPEE